MHGQNHIKSVFIVKCRWIRSEFWWGNLKGRELLKNLGVNETIMLGGF